MDNRIVKNYRGEEFKREDILSYVGEGWHGIVNSLIDDLFDLGWDGTLLQIKEKFGGLRFYIVAGNKEINARIDQAENASFVTCEECGAPGKLRPGGWVKTLCDTHA